MSQLVTRQVEKIINTNDIEAKKDFFQTIDEVALPLKRDTIFFIHVLEKGGSIVKHDAKNQRACDVFIEQFFQTLQGYLPKRVKEVICEDTLLHRALSAIKAIQDRATLRLKLQFDYTLNYQNLVNHFFALSTDTFKSSGALMLLISSMESKYLMFISGNLLNPKDSAEFYRSLLAQKRLDIQFLPQSVQLSEELKAIVLEYYHQEISHAMMFAGYGLGISMMGILMLAQWSTFLAILGGISLTIGVGLVSIFSYEYLTSPWHEQRQFFAI